jgi:hypothetical protein
MCGKEKSLKCKLRVYFHDLGRERMFTIGEKIDKLGYIKILYSLRHHNAYQKTN